MFVQSQILPVEDYLFNNPISFYYYITFNSKFNFKDWLKNTEQIN